MGRKERSKAPKLRTRPENWKDGLVERRWKSVRTLKWPPADWSLLV